MDNAPAPAAAIAADRPADNSTLSRLGRAFRHRNYRLFFGGQIVSLCGTFLSQVATAWLVYRLTHSAWLLGMVAFAGQIPLFLLTPFAGVWVDRWEKRRLLVITQALSLVQSFGLAAVAAAHSLPQHSVILGVLALALVQGLINAFDLPARQAFLVQMVESRDDLANAIALNSTMVHGARLVGPAVAGFLIQYVGEGLCFAIDGVSYGAVIAALLAMRVAPRAAQGDRGSVLGELREGLGYVWGFAPVRVLMLLMALLSLTAMPAYTVLMPIFADALSAGEGGARTLGLLMGASGLGALAGAVYLASRHSVVGLGRVIATGATVFSFGVIAFAMSRHLWLSLLIVPVIGSGMVVNFASANTILQTLVEDRMRGRVMSLFTVAFIGMAPFGNLLSGSLASRLGPGVTGASRTLLIAGAVCVAGAVAFMRALPAMRKLVRPIYVQKGIIPPEVATGLNAASVAMPGTE